MKTIKHILISILVLLSFCACAETYPYLDTGNIGATNFSKTSYNQGAQLIMLDNVGVDLGNEDIHMLLIVPKTTPGFNSLSNSTPAKSELPITNSVSSDYDKIDLQVSAQGTAINSATTFGLDVSISTDPFKKLPNLWLGVSQSLYWQPQFAASTDLDADWIFHAYKNLYINPGWSVGAVYDLNSIFYRTGPELQFQYYITDNVFMSFNNNYDVPSRGKPGYRGSFGFGIEW